MFFREFSKFLVTRFLQNTSGRLRLIVVHHSMLRNLRVHEEDNACSERLSTFSKFRIDIVSNEKGKCGYVYKVTKNYFEN